MEDDIALSRDGEEGTRFGVGPTVLDVHTPNERIDVASVQKVFDLLADTLKRMPERRR